MIKNSRREGKSQREEERNKLGREIERKDTGEKVEST